MHRLIDRIYASALQPDAWSEVLVGVSELFGGSPVIGELYLPRPAERSIEAAGLEEEYLHSFIREFMSGLPWATRMESRFADRFRPISEALPGVDLPASEFYLHWMKPQGLAPIWPLAFTTPTEAGGMLGGLMVFRWEREGAFSEEELRSADSLTAHLNRAIRTRVRLEAARYARAPLAEALDRLPLGMLVLDRKGQVLIENASATQLLALDDGIAIRSAGLAAQDPRENTKLRKLIEATMNSTKGEHLAATSFMQITRPSGREPFSVMISPLLSAPSGSLSTEAVVSCFISDPDAGQVPIAEALEKIYALTPAESEIVQLLARGLSLEEIATDRGISLNTVRSHLKHIFNKTATNRQSELLGLVMTGVASIRSS